MNWFLFALKNTFNFKGRARRREFGWFHFINLIIGFVLIMFVGLSENIGLISFSNVLSIINDIWGYVVMLPIVSLATRRLHDMGLSGWWQLLFYVPLCIIYFRAYQLTGSFNNVADAAFEDIIVQVASFAFLIFVCIMLPILAFVDGDKKSNKYGNSPKYPDSPQTE